MTTKIFLTGMPRSGTTLLANILANNPLVGGGETSPLLEYVFAADANFTNTPEVKSAFTEKAMKESFFAFCKGGIDAYAKEYLLKKTEFYTMQYPHPHAGVDKTIFLDKSRGWIHYAPLLWKFEPDAKIIVCVRDIRGVISSLEKKWRDNPEIMDNRDSQAKQNFITVDQRMMAFLNDPPLGIALKRIRNAIQTGIINDKRILIVRHEDLAIDPEREMKTIYKFLGLKYHEMDYSRVEQMTIENDRISDFGIYGDHKIRSEVKPLTKDWDQVLGRDLSKFIKDQHQWFYDEFGYK